MDLYSSEVACMDGSTTTLSSFRHKVLLIVNTASRCSYSSQFAALQQLYDKYREHGLEILAFPCNQFNGKEPGSNAEIAEYCRNEFRVTFPMLRKIDVRGPKMHSLYEKWIEQAPFAGFDLSTEKGRWMDDFLKEKHPDIYAGDGVKWNFTKFLIGRDGRVAARYETPIEPAAMESMIERLLNEPENNKLQSS